MLKPTIALLAAATLAGCNFAATGPDQDEPQAMATTRDTGLATPPAGASPAAQAPADRKTITADGWGPLRIGMTRTEIETALGPDANPDAVGGPEPEQCEQFRPERAPEGMLLLLEDQKLARISLSDNRDLKTPQGFGIGDSAARIKQALGGRIEAEPHKYADAPAEYLTMWEGPAPQGDRGYVDDANARGIRYEIDSHGKVGMIHAGDDSIQYVEGCL